MSDIGRSVTDLIANYISNEGDTDGGKRIAERAAELANEGSLDSLAGYVTKIVRTHNNPFAAEVRAEMSANDWDRIDWSEVAHQLRD